MIAPWKRTAVRRLAAVLAAFAFVDAVACLAYTWSVGSYLRPPPAGRVFDAAIVFYADFGELGHRSEPLLENAAALIAAGTVPRAICAGGNRPSTGRSGCEQARQWLLARGVPDERIVVDRVSRDTIGNVREATRIARQSGARSVLLLSHAWHAPRVRAISLAKMTGIDTYIFAPSLDGWPRTLYWAEAWRSTHHEAASWLVWKILGEGTLDALVKALRL